MVRLDPAPYLPLTPAQFQVLLALADGEKHGYAIIKEIARRTDGQVELRTGTLYPLIRRALEDRFVEETHDRPEPALDDERRRYYRLTDKGRAVVHAEADRLAETLRQARAKLSLRKA